MIETYKKSEVRTTIDYPTTYDNEPLIKLKSWMTQQKWFDNYKPVYSICPDITEKEYDAKPRAITELSVKLYYRGLEIRIWIDVLYSRKYYVHFDGCNGVKIKIPHRGTSNIAGVYSRISRIIEDLKPDLERLSGKAEEDKKIEEAKENYFLELKKRMRGNLERHKNYPYGYEIKLTNTFSIYFSSEEDFEDKEFLSKTPEELVKKTKINEIRLIGEYSIEEVKEVLEWMRKNPNIIIDKLG